MYVMLADAAASQYDLAGIQKYAPQAGVLAERYQHKLYQAITQRAWGVAHRLSGDYAQSEVKLMNALKLFRELNTCWQVGQVFFELGELSCAWQKPLEAQRWFTEALAAFEEMKAQLDVMRTRAELERLTMSQKTSIVNR